MTVCIYDGKNILVDKAASVDQFGINFKTKKYALHADGLMTGCGNAGALNIVMRMFRRLGKDIITDKKFKDIVKTDDVVIMYIAKDGSCFLFFEPNPFEAIPPVAIGSGATAALGALSAGAKITDIPELIHHFVPSVSADYDLITDLKKEISKLSEKATIRSK